MFTPAVNHGTQKSLDCYRAAKQKSGFMCPAQGTWTPC